MKFRRMGHFMAVIVTVSLVFALSILALQVPNAGIQQAFAKEDVQPGGISPPISGASLGEEEAKIPKLPPQVLAKIEPLLLQQMLEEGQATFIVYLREQADLSQASQIEVLSERRVAVVETLQVTAERSQRSLLDYLHKQEMAGRASGIVPLWIFNGVGVTGDIHLLAEIASRDDVLKIRANHEIRLPDTEPTGPDPIVPQTLVWNIERIRANQVWSDMGITGRGIVVANLDSGVDWQHNALKDKYRGKDGNHDYNWFDPTGTYPQEPGDGLDHGTHVMGTIVGDGVDEEGNRFQIGVAPGAQWIAAKIFDDSGVATDLWIHQGFQWMMAPTNLKGENPDPTKAPDVVNNSWGSGNGANESFRPDVQAMRAAGIVPVFAAGNLRQGRNAVGSVGSPAAFPESIAVGATEPDPVVAAFSAQGPSFWGELKPEISAPGVFIRSSISGNRFAVRQGTSMATPHVVGTIALMLEAANKLQNQLPADFTPTVEGVQLQRAEPMPTVDDLEQFLQLTAVDIGPPGPDNVSGYGRIDAYRATTWAMTAGKLYGFVRDASTGTPIENARVTGVSLKNPEDRFEIRSQADGEYSVAVPEGRYTVEVQAFGYEPTTIGPLQVVAGFLSLRDLTLKQAPTGTVAGQVKLPTGSTPVPVTIEVVGTKVKTQADESGAYRLALPAGTHTLRVTAPGYRIETAEVTVKVGERTVQSFVLRPAPSTLLVDADQWTTDLVTLYYEVVLDKAGIPYDTRPITSTDHVPTAEELSAYDIVIWAHAWTSPGNIDQQREDTATVDAITGYLDQGGRLLITGQDIGWLDGGGNPTNPDVMPYYRDYLHARYTANSVASNVQIVGTPGDIFEGIELAFDTTYAYKRSDRGFSPDQVEPADEMAEPVLDYSEGDSAGLKVQSRNYRLVYLAFSADTTGPRDQLSKLFEEAYDWLSRPVLTKSVDQTEAEPGTRLTYTITFENAMGAALDDVTIVDDLPNTVNFVPGTATGGAVYNAARHVVVWNGSIPPREQVEITFQVDLRSDLAGDTIVTNVAKAHFGDTELEAKASTRVLGPNLSASTKTVDKELVIAGEELVYTLRLINTSVITATGASLVDPIPAGTEYVAGSVTGGAAYDAASREIRWSGDVPAAAPEGAPYTWIDSDTEGGPTYAWDSRAEDEGTRVPGMGDDTISEEISIGFEFPFFDKQFSTFRVSSNGFISFSDTATAFRNMRLPDEDAPKDLVAPFWDDLTLANQGNIYTWTNNTDTLIVSWVEVQRFGGTEPYTFQLILHSNGEIVFQYRQLGQQVDSATIGIQNSDGTQGVTIAFNEPYVHEELAILLMPPQPPAPPPVITFAVRVTEAVGIGETITNTARVDDGTGHITTLTATSRANTTDLTRSQKIAPAITLPGGTFTYTLVLSNTGRLAVDAIVTDPIPAGTSYVADSATGGATFDSAANTIRWTGTVPAGEQREVGFAVTVGEELGPGAIITNVATVDDQIIEPFTLVAETQVVVPDLSRSTKFVDVPVASSGDVLNYTLRIENSSPVPVENVSVVDRLPEGLTYVPDSVVGGEYDPDTNTILWEGTLPARGEGYAWDDSDTPGGPTYAWDDRPETMGVRVRDGWALGDDTSAGPFSIGFLFPFFDENFTEFYVSTNGFASFSPITERFFSNKLLPDPTAPDNLVAVFWDDLDMRSEGEIYYWTNNVDTLVISWVDVPHLARGGPYTFQAILNSDGTLIFQYKDMDPSRISEATIGIQSADGTQGLTIAHDEPYVHNELAVRIAPPTGKEQVRFQAMVNEDVPVESVIVNQMVIKDGLGNEIVREAKVQVNTIDLSGTAMRASANQVPPGGQLTYAFMIPNAGTADAPQARVVNPLPAQVAYVEGSATNGAQYDADTHEIRWEGTVPAGDAVTFSYTVEFLPPLADGEVIINEATISDGVHPSFTRSVSVQVVAPDLSRSTMQALPLVGRNSPLWYEVRLINQGHADADVTFTDVLPADVSYIEGSGQASFGGPISYDGATRTLKWTGTVPPRSIVEIRFAVRAPAEVMTLVNEAVVTDSLGTTIPLSATTRVVPYRSLMPLFLKNYP